MSKTMYVVVFYIEVEGLGFKRTDIMCVTEDKNKAIDWIEDRNNENHFYTFDYTYKKGYFAEYRYSTVYANIEKVEWLDQER